MSPEEQLYELLKTADTMGKQVTTKSDPTPPATNETQPEAKGSATFYKQPEGEPAHKFTQDIKSESQKDRDGALEELLGPALSTASNADQKSMGRNFDHVKAHDFESHSVLLKPSAPKDKTAQTLMQRVLKLTGRI